MPWIDIVLLVLLAGFALTGLWLGFVQTLGNIVGTVVGIMVASHLIDPVAHWFGWATTAGWQRVLLFIFLYGLVSRLFDLAFWIVRKVLGFVAWVPFVPTINRILGAVLGLIEGGLAIAAALFIASTVLPEATVQAFIHPSVIAQLLLVVTSVVKYLLPEAMRLVSAL